MTIGYANGLDLESLKEQLEQLENNGVEKTVSEQVDGRINRIALDKMVEGLRKGDVVKVVSLKYLPLTALQCLELITVLNNKEIELRSLSEQIDMLTVNTFYQLDRRTRSQRAKGVLADSDTKPGPKPGILSEENRLKALRAIDLHKNYHLQGKMSIDEILKDATIASRSTLYKYFSICGYDYKKAKKYYLEEQAKKKAD